MEGLVELAEEVFHVPVRLGVPQAVTGLADVVRNPVYATGVGLLFCGRQNMGERQLDVPVRGLKGVWERMCSWFQGSF